MEATLLIYSGRPNPRWRIDPAAASEIGSAIAAMAEADGPPATPGGLGYSGVALDFADESGARRQAVFAQGKAMIGGKAYVDDGRRIERALLASGRNEVAEIDQLL